MDADITYDPPESREAKLARAQQLNVVLSVVGIAAAAANLFGGVSMRLPADVVLALIPAGLLYLVQHEPQVYAIGKPKGDLGRSDLAFAFMVCGFGLIAGLNDYHFLQAATVTECAGLVGLLCCCVTFAAAQGNSRLWSAMLSTFFVGAIYGWGLVGTVDSIRDSSAPAYYTTLVTDRYETHGRSTTYHLALAPWGPMQEADSLTVSSQSYDRTAIGSQVCLELHSGELRVQWYRVVACDRKPLE